MRKKKGKPFMRYLLNTLLITVVLSVGYIFYTIVFDLRVRLINRSELKDLAGVNKDFAARFEGFVNDIENETDWKVSIISGLRTRDEQIQLKRENPRNAPANKSRHVLGRAVDINLYKREGFRTVWLKKASSIASWQKAGVMGIAKRYGLLWGGTYKNYHDPVHFEIN